MLHVSCFIALLLFCFMFHVTCFMLYTDYMFKSPIRIVLFSGAALYITSLWNTGFAVKMDIVSFVSSATVVGVLFYIIKPMTKLALFPLNFLSFGLASFLVFSFLFYVTVTSFSFVTIQSWVFPGMKVLSITIPKMPISGLQNIILSSLSISVIIKTLEKVL